MPKEAYVPCLLKLFRQYGYDGTTLAKISEATGLGKASLYHHFPGGKDEMVETVLDYSRRWLETNILATLASEGDAYGRLQRMCDRIFTLYGGGQEPCLLAILLLGSGRDIFHASVKARLRMWIDAIATVLIQSGLDETLAQHRAESALIAIQGSLILAQGLEDLAPFQRVLQTLPTDLCAGLASAATDASP